MQLSSSRCLNGPCVLACLAPEDAPAWQSGLVRSAAVDQSCISCPLRSPLRKDKSPSAANSQPVAELHGKVSFSLPAKRPGAPPPSPVYFPHEFSCRLCALTLAYSELCALLDSTGRDAAGAKQDLTAMIFVLSASSLYNGASDAHCSSSCRDRNKSHAPHFLSHLKWQV